MHHESLLRIPLLRHLRDDHRVRLEPRRVDKHWYYQGVTELLVTGFNPFVGRVFYGEKSFFARWLTQPEASARELNEGDFLVSEAMFCAHDYLHVWSLFVINGLRPALGIGVAPITKENVEDFAFCHLVTEAAATVGLDYWYLSTVDFDAEVPIGSTFDVLTVGYHERHGTEYRRISPDFVVQERPFFDRLAKFYCDGVFPGFDLSDLKRSPRILAWLRHELQYGRSQRHYIRQWLSYLSGGAVTYTREQLDAPLDATAPWKRDLIAAVGERLWEKVKLDRLVLDGTPIPEDGVWRSPATQRPDFRFVNASRIDPARLQGMDSWENAAQNFGYYLSQYLSTFDYAGFDPLLRKLIPSLRERRDPELVHDLFKGQPALPARDEVTDMLILN